MKNSDIGLIGLAVMGENLVMNIESKGYTVSVYNRSNDKVSNFINGRAKGKNIIGTFSIDEFLNSLKSPRRILIMVKAGDAVDELITILIDKLSNGDIIIDGGNSNYKDTIRRTKLVEERGLYYVGTGVSGGEEGALKGPSIMPGGSKDAWIHIKDLFQSISAKVENNEPCCEWVGNDGAGHFVKMIHNGIEYGDMQLISEVYQILKIGLDLKNDEISDIFTEWNNGDLNSYLIEITGEILKYRDEDGDFLVDKILDNASQKGTGKWTAITSLEEGVSLSLIVESVFARCISNIKDQRIAASKVLNGPEIIKVTDKLTYINHLKNTLYASKIISYAQGFSLMIESSKKYNWNLNYGEIALMWRGGCIIRSAFLGKIKEAFEKEKDLSNLMLDPYFTQKITSAQSSMRNIVSYCALNGIPIPTISSALNYYDSYRSEWLPANIIQAQRDYFGAHTFERNDRKKGEFFHINWNGRGGSTSSSSYNV